MPAPSSPARSRWVAGFVTIAGATLIWAWSASRQSDQTEALSRQWVGEQWDVARNCLLGTPIGRGQDAEAILVLLDAMLLETLAAASEADDPPDARALWPGRCAPLFASLRVDRSILRSDPGDALSLLEALAPRVLRTGPEEALDLDEARERARELAEPIARLDAAMPSGAEYDVREYERAETGVHADVVVASLACPSAGARRRPFLDGQIGEEELFDELEADARSLRLSGSRGGPFELTITSADGTDVRAVAREGMRHPLLWDDRTLLWLHADAARVTLAPLDESADESADASTVSLDDAPVERIALCRAGEGAHLVAQRGDEVFFVRWPAPERAPTRAVPVRPRPPASGAVVACSADALALAWHEEGVWRGALCEGDACQPLPPLRAGDDLELAVGRDVLAIARGRRTDAPLARRLVRDGALAWSAPTVVPRGALRASAAGFRIELCQGGALRSADGARWEE